ncbi:hypothetical protein SDC9_130846 [bioreactor metagenome]|uniref:Transposase n=1 Tax=bioreactor metagenome TaxID=1076179 RepID=A0A645D3P4_9ZZZZ
MKRTKFTEHQILAILKQQEAGAKVSDICREHGISDAPLIIGKQNTAVWMDLS